MANSIEAKYINLYIHPDETRPPFNTAAELLNAVLPFAEKIDITELGPVSLAPPPKYSPNPVITHFFPDGIVSLQDYDKKGYQEVVDSKKESYTMHLRAILSGVRVDISYRTSVRWEERSPTK